MRLVVIIIIAIAILSYFRVDIRSLVESQSFRDNFGFVWDWLLSIYNNFLARPVSYIWNEIIVKLLWNSFIENLERIKGGDGPSLIDSAPQAPK